MRPRIAVVGSINADLAVNVSRHPMPGETIVGTSVAISAGGKGANQAVAAAQLGAHVSFIGALGNDTYAQAASEFLRGSGADVENVTEINASTGLAVITVSADGENSIVVIPGANQSVDADYVQCADAQTGVISNADILLIQGEIPRAGNEKAIELARSSVSDCAARVMINLAPVVPLGREFLLTADPLVANEHEAGLILEQLGAENPGEDKPELLLEALLAQGFRSVVVTLGAQGALCGSMGGVRHIPAVPVDHVVDTTGAGDAFCGALAARLAEGDSLVDACHYASRVGAYAVMGKGAQSSYPTLESRLPELPQLP